jgi:hypothetical protein
MPAQPRPLTPRQRLAAEEFLKSGCQTAAYLRAGFTAANPAHARANASRLFKRPAMQAYLAELRRPLVEQAQEDFEAHLRDLKALRDAAREAGQFGPSVTAEVNRGKAKGFYVDRKEITSADAQPQVIVYLPANGRETGPDGPETLTHNRSEHDC